MVYLERCNTLEYNEDRLPGAQILRGEVRFRHDKALMYCDSAYFYERSNSLTAFSHVRMVQGDTLSGYSDVMYYDGNTKVARFRRHVRLVHRHTTLRTDSLNFDRSRDYAWYYTGGTIEDSLNVLTSIRAHYYTNTAEAEFNDSVVLVNDNYTLTTQRLQYNTDNRIARLVCPTEIVYEKDTRILSDRGWYNTRSEQSMLLHRSRILQENGKKRLVGDTIYYDKPKGYRQVLGHVESVDSVQKTTMAGGYAEMYEEHNRGFVTRQALMIDWSDSAKLSYMHADTLFTAEVPYVLTVDSATVDTFYREQRGHGHVRVWRKDAQTVCGLSVYNGRDSVMHLYRDPICWSDNQQISADSVIMYMKNEKIDRIHGLGNALVVQHLGENYYNQMTGKDIWAYMQDEALRQMDISGNAQTIFYPDEDGALIGMNTTESGFIKIFIKDQKMDHAVFTAETTGTLYPLDQIPPGSDRLAPFFWAEDQRPKSPEDVLVDMERIAHPKAGVKSAAAAQQ